MEGARARAIIVMSRTVWVRVQVFFKIVQVRSNVEEVRWKLYFFLLCFATKRSLGSSNTEKLDKNLNSNNTSIIAGKVIMSTRSF